MLFNGDAVTNEKGVRNIDCDVIAFHSNLNAIN